MASGGFALALLALCTLCSYGARRTEDLVARNQSTFILGNDTQRVDASSPDVFRNFAPVGSLLQHDSAVRAPFTMKKKPKTSLHQVSDECFRKMYAASIYCRRGEAAQFYTCTPLLYEEDPVRSFLLEEVCLADIRKYSELTDVKTGCCSDHPDYQGGCCKVTRAGAIAPYLGLTFTILCCCCCGRLVFKLRF
eukprot:TRINITY_DN7373_c0_g3_i1.p1 TRINITY_DN7373_c0_g3~~TRINITY_DN7373_c0_g3_i1.p1  ORF type:complete len:193 (-),score=12.10 TRINITY_DN7373_c0_g3_i1:275-853(-)